MQQFTIPRFAPIFFIIFLMLQGCGPDTTSTRADDLRATQDQHAQALFNNGDFGPAADEFLRLAKQQGADQSGTYLLFAAEALIEAGQNERASNILQSLQRIDDQANQMWQQLLNARLLLRDNRATEAMAALNLIRESNLPGRLQASLFRTQADAYDRLGNAIESARARIRLSTLLLVETDKQENREAIWETVNRLRGNILQQLLPADFDELRGWMELAILARLQINDASSFTLKLNQWQETYPNHPGHLEVLAELSRNSQILDITPTQIAVLLPFNGRYASAASAVRDGLISAWYTDSEARPELLFYDANAANISSVYAQAIDAGADFIVGPLEKDAVSVLQENGELPAVTLALNRSNNDTQTPTVNDTGLYQFGLSPEDEARQVAERAWFDGHLSALVITPEGVWGERIHAAFQQRWTELGGRVSEQQKYVNNSNDFSSPIKKLLNIDSSEQRAKKLRQTIGTKISFEPRNRQDVDFVFIAAYPQAGRQIRPQLLFHNAAGLPVYSTSHIYTGLVDSEKDRDLDGIVFADMPWLLDDGIKQSGLYQSIAANWPQSSSSARLYALGVDAYALIPQLGKLLLQPYQRYHGVSGTLSMNQAGWINRQMQWAMFQGGKPRSLDALRVVD